MPELSQPELPDTRMGGPIRRLIDLFSSVWFGITLMVLIFIYLTLGSAGILHPVDWSNPFGAWTRWVVRESFNKTEMEVFNWWPFTTLIALLVINMVVVTIRRIRLTVLSAGVWMIHTGIVTLALGSVYYFGTKLEGDAPVFRRNVLIEVPGASPQRLVVRRENATTVDTPNGRYSFQIAGINPDWPLLSGEDKGKTACSVNISVTTPTDSFIRQMLMNYPQYTEDILPGQGRAIKAIGRKLIDENIRLIFEYEPQDSFYLMDSAALYVREVGANQWTERPIEGLPHYTNHISSITEIWQPDGDPVIQPDPLNIVVTSPEENDPLQATDVRVTGRLHYSPGDEVRAVPGGSRLNPVLGMRLDHGGRSDAYELMALEQSARDIGKGVLSFRWADTVEQREAYAAQVGSASVVRAIVAGAPLPVIIPTDRTSAREPDLPFTPIEGTDWSYRVRGTTDELQVPGGDSVSVVIVEFASSDRSFTRWVADDPARTRDVKNDSFFPPASDIETFYERGATVMIVAGPEPDDLTAVVGQPTNRATVNIGQPIELGQGLIMTSTYYYPQARFERRPVVTPMRQRRDNVGPMLSRIKLLLHDGAWSQEVWLDYHRYPLPSEQYRIAGRFRYDPTVLRLSDGRLVEMIFSRKRWPLPAALALDDFELQTHTGGYTGQTTSVRDFVSRLRSYKDGTWSEPFTASLNNPASVGGTYFFQSEWDPGTMAYTGLGVGNRNGVYIQLAGTCISVLGMIYVFYIKPVIKRRRQLAVYATVAAQESKARAPAPVSA